MTLANQERLDWDKFRGLSENEIEETALSILSKMTLKEKIRQMSGDEHFIIGFAKMVRRYNVKPISAGENKRLGIPGIRFSDGPRGVAMGKSTCFPVSIARGATWEPELEEKIGNAIGIEARTQGANYYGGVCINLLRHPSWGRAQETYGEDPVVLGAFGVALVKGTQKHVMACAKHYALNSIENSRFKVDVRCDERTLREVYLPHFKKCVDAGVASIMNAYNKVNGKYCGHNPHLLRDILKNDWQFKGFVVTDFGLGIRSGKAAINAGVDIEMPHRWRITPRKIIKLIKKGKVTEEYIDEAVVRILRQKLRFTRDYSHEIYNKDRIACKEHVQLALEAARKGIVLLKNENNILPLNREEVGKIAIIGKLADEPNIGDHGSSRVYPPYIVTALEGIRNAATDSVEVVYDKGSSLNKVKELVSNVDVVIVVAGFKHSDEGEYISILGGGDRFPLELKPKDEKLITTIASINKNCIVILEGGSAIIMEAWKDKVPAILMAWYPGMEGGTAIGEILFGDFNPCGKLPLTFPKSSDQLPYFKKKIKSIEYGFYHGYKLFEKEGEEPAFPFGFGLSYTTFSYDNLRIDKNKIKENEEIQVSIDVTNEGSMSGEEIVQLYVGYKNSKVDRPIKELKCFGKLLLKPGETKTLRLSLRAEDLAYYELNKNKWKVEPIEYNIYLGSSSRDKDLLTTSFSISGS